MTVARRLVDPAGMLGQRRVAACGVLGTGERPGPSRADGSDRNGRALQTGEGAGGVRIETWRRQDYRIGRRMSIRIDGDDGRTAPAEAGEVTAVPAMDSTLDSAAMDAETVVLSGAVAGTLGGALGLPEDPAKAAWFEYIGKTALVLRGPYTGQRYWFERPGARLQVDPRDRHALLAVPVLRLVPN